MPPALRDVTYAGGPALRLAAAVLADTGLGAGQQAADVGVMARIDKHSNRQRQLNGGGVGERLGEKNRAAVCPALIMAPAGIVRP